ncbi:MAG: GIY-YIG nuclease family protein [Syntrophaceae bacterium]|nr:GIY-YIG nuclease family protein [Syntrophaceae bacterium]
MRYKVIIVNHVVIYVLQSFKDGKHYVGMTRNLQKRISQHNNGKVKSTKSRRPFTLVYYEELSSSQEARIREKYLKSATGRRFLKKVLGSKDSLPG